MQVEFLDVIFQELEKSELYLEKELDQEGSSKARIREKNFDFLTLLLEHPEFSPREYEKRIEDYAAVPKELRWNNLSYPKERKRLADIMKSISNETARLITQNAPDPFPSYDSVAKIILSKYFSRRRLEGKIYLIALFSCADWATIQNEEIQKIKKSLEILARKGSYKLCREVARRIVSHIGVKYGFEKKKSRTEVMQSILEDIEGTKDIDIDDYRTTLVMVRKELTDLKEDIELEINTRTSDFLTNFFITMNSARNSYLLDTIIYVSDELSDENSPIQQDFKQCKNTLEILVKIFLNFIKLNNVIPIEHVNATIEISTDQLVQYEVENFSYDDYLTNREAKLLALVKTSGWKFNKVVISKPKIEIINK